jgi:DNA modification methylase
LADIQDIETFIRRVEMGAANEITGNGKVVITNSEQPLLTPARRKSKFKCASCGIMTDAPVGTQRASRLLCKQCFGRGEDHRPRELNELTGAEWAAMSRSVEEYPDVRSEKQRIHGACFPQSLAEQQIKIFTKPGETVLDPFVGVGTTIDAAIALRRKAIGIELNPHFADMARHNIQEGGTLGSQAQIITGDARNLLKYVSLESVDFVLTSAHKWREHSSIDPIPNPTPYSSSSDDLGNMSYPDYLDTIGEILSSTMATMKPRTYAVWVVKDFRNPKQGVPYVNLHGDIIDRAQSVGLTLWDIRIYNQTRFRPLVCLGYPSRNFYLNIGHSYLLTFKKE